MDGESSMTPIYLSVKDGTPAEGYWDQALIADLLEDIPEGDRQVFVIPGAYQGGFAKRINEELSKFERVLVFITSDEEGNFDCKKLWHPDLLHYHQYNQCENVFPLGYTPQTRPILKELELVRKDIKWFFSGQINHSRRRSMRDQLLNLKDGVSYFSPGFSQGLQHKEYFEWMAKSNSVICPPGNLTQDSFRVYETLEAGAIPIVDRFPPTGDKEYWSNIFPDAPFPILRDYQELPGLIEKCQSPSYKNKVFAWWVKKKFELREKIREQINSPREVMTVVVPTSVIPSHPSTEIIEQTIESIRHHMDAPVLITIDGLREEQKDRKADYDEYVRRLLWKCNFEWKNVAPVFFDTHKHQSEMMKAVLPMIKTPLLLYVEHDTPLVMDEETEWELIVWTILQGHANVVRFHYEAVIPQEHQYLMLDKIGDKFLQTKQWSQRPHLARTEFYQDAMRFFTDDSNCFIEDRLYSECERGDPKDWKVFIYTPGDNIKRSLNLDGRKDDHKYEKEQRW